MKITLLEVAEAFTAMNAIKEGNELPILIAWAMGDWVTELAPINERYNEQRNDLLKKYGKPSPENTNEFMIQPENVRKFTPELEKLNAIEVNLNGPKKLNLDELQTAGVKIPPGVSLTALRLFIQ